MFERLITAISQLQRNIEWFDPASLNDPVALTTAWHPAKRGGTNFRTHQLVQQGSQRLSFRPTLTSWLIASAFIGSGPLMAVLFYFRHPFPLGNIPPTMLLILAMCSVFSLIGVYYSARYLGTVTFDNLRARVDLILRRGLRSLLRRVDGVAGNISGCLFDTALPGLNTVQTRIECVGGDFHRQPPEGCRT